MKPKIIHIIDSFSKGGAEMLLSGMVPFLKEYDNYIIYLTPAENTFQMPADISVECIEFRGTYSFFSTLKKLRKRFNEINPDIIHSHLIFATLFSRLLLSKKTALVTTYHNLYYRVQYKTIMARLKRSILQIIDSVTYKKSYSIIHVSQYQQIITDHDVGIKKSIVIYNYIEDVFFRNSNETVLPNTLLKIISVGNLKTEKNHILLLKAIQQLNDIPLQVDIYGGGPDHEMLQQYIDKYHLPVFLKGSSDSIDQLLQDYNLFVQASIIEGFGISVAEAMAAGIPLILSDIPTLKEITDNKALFFESNNIDDLANKIRNAYKNPATLKPSVIQLQNIAERYRKEFHLTQIRSLYSNILNKHSV